MKKLLSTILLMAIVSTMLACYVVNSQEMSKVKGTYVMTKYVMEYTDRVEDRMEMYHEVAYLVIREDGKGYYVSGSDREELTCREIDITFEHDSEKPNLISNVVYKYNGSDDIRFGVTYKALNRYLPKIDLGILQRPYSLTINYAKVSEATDLSYVESDLGKSLQPIEYALQPYHGIEELVYTQGESPYVYCYADIDCMAKKAALYYGVMGDDGQIIRTNESYDLGYSVENREVMWLKIGERKFERVEYYTLAQRYTLNDEECEVMLFAIRDGRTVEQIIEDKIEEYNALIQEGEQSF